MLNAESMFLFLFLNEMKRVISERAESELRCNLIKNPALEREGGRTWARTKATDECALMLILGK